MGISANQAGWPCQVLSDTLIVHQYLTSEAFDHNRSIAVYGATILPPTPVPVDQINQIQSNPPAPPTASVANQDSLVAQLKAATGMNNDFATMCLAQNGWDYEAARRNFEEIKNTIPAEAFQ